MIGQAHPNPPQAEKAVNAQALLSESSLLFLLIKEFYTPSLREGDLRQDSNLMTAGWALPSTCQYIGQVQGF